MRLLLLILFCMASPMFAFSQKIDYKVPRDYKKDIAKEDYRMIVDLSVPIIANRYTIDRVADGTVHLRPGQDTQLFNLHNLIGKCLQVKDKSQWKPVVQEHFDKIYATIDAKGKLDLQDFASVKPYLSLRLYPQSFVQGQGAEGKFVVRTDLAATYTMLMLDLPNAFTPVPIQAFSGWKQDTAELFRIAQANVNAQQVEVVTREFEFEGAKVTITFLGNEDYAASYALDLARNAPGAVGEWGAAVAIPNKGLANACPISRAQPLDFVTFIRMTKSLIEKSYAEHPQRISDQYFWYYQGTFTPIQVLTDGAGKINVVAPLGLAALMSEKK